MPTSAVLNTASTRVRTIAVPWPAVGVLMFGLVMLYSVGFSTFTRTHNAAHERATPTGFLVTEAVVSQFRKLMLAVFGSGALRGSYSLLFSTSRLFH